MVAKSGSVEAEGNTVMVKGADEVLVFVVAATNSKDPYAFGELSPDQTIHFNLPCPFPRATSAFVL